jgi:hypothetical protein
MNKKLIDNHIFMELGAKITSRALTEQEISNELWQNMEQVLQSNLGDKVNVKWSLWDKLNWELNKLWWEVEKRLDEETN